MEFKLELVVVPVTDVDRAKAFYTEQAGFNADHDHTVSDEIRFVQMTPPGSACSICLGNGITEAEPGSVKGLQLVVADAAAAHAELAGRGVEVSDVQDFPWGRFVFFADPDGNRWSVQELAWLARMSGACARRPSPTCSPRGSASRRTCGRRRCSATRTRGARRHAGLGQAREPPARRRLQGARRREPRRPALARRAARGVIGASTGNHGQSIAYAARLFGVRAIVCVPEGANPVKVDAMRGLGAEIVEHGRDFDEAREHCGGARGRAGYRYIHSGDEPDLIAGVATRRWRCSRRSRRST